MLRLPVRDKMVIFEPTSNLIETESSGTPMGDLIDQIVSTHHVVLRAQLLRIEQIAGDITGFEGASEPVLIEIRQLVGGLRACAESQLDKEERALFPTLKRLEHQTIVTKCHAGMINSRISMAERDLARVRGVIHRLKELAHEHLSPTGPCEACHELLKVIDEVLLDLRKHTHKECEILFPWAIAREAALAR
jgi:regulator of cell morphogenesis and NO signaling